MSDPRPVLVMDLGGTWSRLGHLGPSDEPTPMQRVSSDGLRGPHPIEFLAEWVRRYVRERRLEPGCLVVGVPFTPDPKLETALSSPNVRSLERIPLRSGLEEALGLPVRLERDINLLLMGEWRSGSAAGAGAVFGMFVGTGVGGCYLEDGVPFRGASGSAVELGHVPIRGEGRRCVCGNLDCLEAYACGHVLHDLADRHGKRVEALFADPRRPASLDEALRAFVRDLAYALATAVNLFQPELAVVGGGVPRMAGFPRDRFVDTFQDHLRRPVPRTTTSFAWARLGSEAALHGARLVASRERIHP